MIHPSRDSLSALYLPVSCIYCPAVEGLFTWSMSLRRSTPEVWEGRAAGNLVQLTVTYSCLGAQLCLTTTPWTGACQAFLSVGFSWQEYWSGSPFPPPGDLPDPGMDGTCTLHFRQMLYRLAIGEARPANAYSWHIMNSD